MSSSEISYMNIFDIHLIENEIENENENDYVNTICHDRILNLTKKILSNENYYLKCVQYCYEHKLDYDDFDFSQIHLINSVYLSNILDSIYTYDSTIKNEEYLINFLDKLTKFFKFVLNYYTKPEIEYTLGDNFLGNICPYEDCDNFIFGYREKCDICNRNVAIRCSSITKINDTIDYESYYDLEDSLYYETD